MTVITVIIIIKACFQVYKVYTHAHTHTHTHTHIRGISVANPYVDDMNNGRMRSPMYRSARPVL